MSSLRGGHLFAIHRSASQLELRIYSLFIHKDTHGSTKESPPLPQQALNPACSPVPNFPVVSPSCDEGSFTAHGHSEPWPCNGFTGLLGGCCGKILNALAGRHFSSEKFITWNQQVRRCSGWSQGGGSWGLLLLLRRHSWGSLGVEPPLSGFMSTCCHLLLLCLHRRARAVTRLLLQQEAPL